MLLGPGQQCVYYHERDIEPEAFPERKLHLRPGDDIPTGLPETLRREKIEIV